jgi:tetratricopeptide (TPR) repeat protein
VTWDGRYQLQRTLGEGGMGRVLLARDLAEASDAVAIKILLPEFRHSIGTFLDEYVVQRGFDHPNIPRVHDFGFAKHPRGGEVPYFSLEYCRGIPLILAIRRVKRLQESWPWMAQLLRALDYIHRMGWLHRDLKPGNVLVDMQDTGDRSCRLIDLGVATRLGKAPEGFFIGTPEYCAPEMLAGDPFDQRSDLYAFGLVLYELVERKRPWSGSDENELLKARLKNKPPEISHPDCPADIKTLIYELLDPDPSKRPSHAHEVLVRLCEATNQEPVVETESAFGKHLQASPFPGRDAFLSAGDGCLSWLKPGMAVETDRPRLLVARAPGGYDAGWLLHELADRGAVGGSRVIRMRFTGSEGPLECLKPAIDIFSRLRKAENPDENLDTLRGCSGAATMLTRLHGPTLLVIEDLQRADHSSIAVLEAALTAARNEKLRVMASVNPDEEPTAPEAFAQFIRMEEAQVMPLQPISVEQTALWIERTVGRGVFGPEQLSHLHEASKGAPAGLIAVMHDLFRRGTLKRVGGGYVLEAGVDTTLAAPSGAEVGRLDALLAILQQALPETIIERYFNEDAEYVPALLTDGVLSPEGDGRLAVSDDRWRQGIYESLREEERQHLHRRLARAIHAEDRFNGQRKLVADHLMLSDRPVLAAPHLVVAASEAGGAEAAANAAALLDQAEDLLERQLGPEEADEAWRWRAMLYKARVRQAMQEGDLKAFDKASAALVEVGTEAAHMPTLAFALETQVVSSFEQRDWTRMTRQAEARVALEPGRPGVDALGLRSWARVMSAYSSGDTAGALQAIQDARQGERPRPAVWMRLMGAFAEILTELEWTRDAQRAIEEYRSAAGQAGEGNHELTADLLAARLLVQAGKPEAALEALIEVSVELPADHVRGLSSRVELDLARLHLDFGWAASARDHAEQAASLGERDTDSVAVGQALLAEAAALQLERRRGHAAERLQQVTALVRSAPDWTLMADARLGLMNLSLKNAPPAVAAKVVREAHSLVAQANKRQAFGRAARAAAYGARALLLAGKPVEGLQLAEDALQLGRRKAGWKHFTHQLLFVLSLARRGVGRNQAADAVLLQAVDALRGIAGTIEDAEKRKNWVSTPDNEAILGLTGQKIT